MNSRQELIPCTGDGYIFPGRTAAIAQQRNQCPYSRTKEGIVLAKVTNGDNHPDYIRESRQGPDS